jgi:hypothetical protein
MSGRNAGFHPKGAVVSILSALRERNGGEVADGGRPDTSPVMSDAPSARFVAALSGGHSMFILIDAKKGVEGETKTWGGDQERHGVVQKMGVGRVAFSIRSPEGKCVAVILADGDPLEVREVLQPRFLSHALPSASIIAKTLIATGLGLGRFEQLFGCVVDSSGKLRFLEEVPERLELEADYYGHFHDPVALPPALASSADFTLMDSVISRNAQSMSVGGTLSLANTRGLVLPAMLNVGMDLLLHLSDADRLPERFSVGRDLNIAFTPIRELPEHFFVGRHVLANDSSVSRIRGGSRFKGNLDLRNCPITDVPWGLEVDGYLDLTGTDVRHIPSGTVVNGDLRVEESVDIHPRVKIGGRLLYGRPYGYDTAQRG